MCTPPVEFILNMAASQVLTAAIDQFDPVIEALQDRIETSPAYLALWESLPADVRPELGQFAIELNGLINDAFLAGLLCSHFPQVG